ncbi:MAG TPA: winged helix-turn-helix domain-containing protein [Pyrinomonadaceae bacterium]|nr:winged helix-turn-helix domain-containing protein [Pyrinomonadaceae bacterium]
MSVIICEYPRIRLSIWYGYFWEFLTVTSTSAESKVYEFGEFRLDEGKRLIFDKNDEALPLMPKAFEVLLYLVGNSGRLIEKDELMSAVWIDTIVEENNLNKNISILRRVLGENLGDHRYIVTVPGRGYKFVADVRQAVDDDHAQFKVGSLSESLKLQAQAPSWKPLVLPTLALVILGALAAWYFWPHRERIVPSPSFRTIAVLPFRPLVAENRDEALEMGMADTLISALGNSRDLIVRPLSSVRNFGGLDQDAVQAGQSLAVDSVLDGNIQHWGDKIRVNARLMNVGDGTILWAGTFEEKFTNIFVVQDAIASRVVSALAIRLTAQEKPISEKRHTKSVEAYTSYLRGRYHFFKITGPEIRKGISYFEEAIAADPNYALAYAGMADAYRTLASAAFAPSKEVCPKARSLAVKALELDESLAEAHIVLGWISFLYDWDWTASERELKRAIELSPNNSEARRAYAHMLSNSGRHDEAIAEGRLARELAPLTLITAALEGQFLFFGGHSDEGIELLQRTIDLEPNFWVARNVLARIYLREGRVKEAISELQISRSLAGHGLDTIMQLGYAFAISGEPHQARAVSAELDSYSRTGFVPSYSYAMIYNGLGMREKALDHLERSALDREIQLAFIGIETRWDDLRSEPRFIKLIEQLNFGDASDQR